MKACAHTTTFGDLYILSSMVVYSDCVRDYILECCLCAVLVLVDMCRGGFLRVDTFLPLEV